MARVTVVPYSPAWPALFEAARTELLALFSRQAVRLEHIGSTAVPGLSAKPVLDLLLGAPALAPVEAAIPRLAVIGYEYVPKYERELPERRYFVRAAGPSPAGMTLRIHLHAVVAGSRIWHQHLAFRDALRADAALRLEYEQLKRGLAERHGDDKAAYQAAKDPFIAAFMASRALDQTGG